MDQAKRRSFGQVRKLPSGRYQARFRREGTWHTAKAADGGPRTFTTRKQAERWLDRTEEDIAAGVWQPHVKAAPVPVFSGYAEDWLATRELKDRTRAHYRALLDRHLIPAFGEVKVPEITPAMVREWHSTIERKTLRAHAYSLLRTILGTAVHDDLLPSNPCRIRGAGSTKREREIRPLTVAELGALVEALPERYRLAAQLAAWCALRFGELTELRRKDVDAKDGVLHVRRAVTWHRSTGFKVGTTKGDRARDVAVPPHLLPELRKHLRSLPVGPESLVFPSRTGGHLQASTVYKIFKPARESIGRPDLRWHDLRHTGAVLAAVSGATLAELMHRLGHTTPAVAMRYQHVAEDRDKALAVALSKLAEGTVTEIRREAATE
jgi:integrase